MYRIQAYRPNLRKGSYGKVKTHQWSEKPNNRGIEYALSKIAYESGHALSEKISEVHVHEIRGKISGIWLCCSRQQYEWDRGFHSFMVYFRPKKYDFSKSHEESEQEKHDYLVNFLKGCEKFFKENELNVKVFDGDLNETSIGEIISRY